MPRANRTFVPGHVWHLTHRCHKKEFLLKFVKDRRCWLHWLFEAKKRYKLRILNYIVTSNHIHLLVMDTGNNSIPSSMQLVAAQTAQRFNKRKGRKGAFWEDRYNATAVQADSHVIRCLVYIDLNMVRAGVVEHPAEWRHSGYREIQSPPMRYALINLPSLTHLCGFRRTGDFQKAHKTWVSSALNDGDVHRDPRWTESRAVGTEDFTSRFEEESDAAHDRVEERSVSYTTGNEVQNDALRLF